MNRKVNLAALIFLGAFLNQPAFAVSYSQLAREMTPLLEKMAAKDPAKLTMVLRLADVYFESAIEVNKNSDLSNKQVNEIEKNQKKAIELYEYALSGLNGAVVKPNLDTQYRIDFQLARLYTDTGQIQKADIKWTKLVQQSQIKQIQLEAALRLSEKLEISTQNKDLVQAASLYDLALKNCVKSDLCSYIEYRRGWVSYRLGQSDEAVAFLMKSLVKSDRSSLDEILKDLILFLARSSIPTTRATEILEQYSVRFKKSQLLEKLAANYFSADRGQSYYEVTQYLLKKDPHIDQYIAMLELEYSQGRAAELQKTLESLELAQKNNLQFLGSEQQTEAEKVLFRLIFQWDGERKMRPESFTTLANQSSILYTKIFPLGPQIEKVMDGWLAIQENPSFKLQQVDRWNQQQRHLGKVQICKHLDQVSLSLAVQMKDWNRVLSTSEVLLQKEKDLLQIRTLTYQKAKSLYELKRYEEALPLLKSLALAQGGKPDSFAIFSQNLALDILAKQENFDELQIQAKTWTQNSRLSQVASGDRTLTKELSEMRSISDQAAFTLALKSNDQTSLKSFRTFCLADQFLPKSCDNAKILAQKYHDTNTTIVILRHQGLSSELADELEFAGRFVESAHEREKNLRNQEAKSPELFRLALLFELGGDLKERDRVLSKLTQQYFKLKKDHSPETERLLFHSLTDANLITNESLKLPWTDSIKLEIAEQLEDLGKGNQGSKNLLLQSCENHGNTWRNLHLRQMQSLAKVQTQLSIVGSKSQKNFKKRVDLLSDLVTKAQCYLKGEAQTLNRVLVLSSIAESYSEFSRQIKAVPLPEGLDETTLAEVKLQIATMAEPFDKINQTWAVKAQEEVGKLETSQRDFAIEHYVKDNANFNYEMPPAVATKKVVFNWNPLLNQLKENPYNSDSLRKLKSHFENEGRQRLALYFEGRLTSGGTE